MHQKKRCPGAVAAARGTNGDAFNDDRNHHSPVVLKTQAPPAFSEDALALQFAEKYAVEFRYVSGTSSRHKWFFNIGNGDWSVDDTLRVLDAVRAICRDAAARCGNPLLAREIASAATVSAVERLARSDHRLAAPLKDVGIGKKHAAKPRKRRTARKAVMP